MKTYDTYQEAKISNPECEIYHLKDKGLFAHCTHHKSEIVRFVEFASDGVKCNPADYCMTVEKFLADGNKFVEGDLIYSAPLDSLINVTKNELMDGKSYSEDGANTQMPSDNERYILRAAALEEKDTIPSIHPDSEFYKKTRLKVEHVKCDIESRGQALDAFDNEIELFELVDGEYKQVTTESDAISKWRNLYERIETPMTEREAFIEELQSIWIIDGVDGQEQLEKIVDSGLFKLVN